MNVSNLGENVLEVIKNQMDLGKMNYMLFEKIK